MGLRLGDIGSCSRACLNAPFGCKGFAFNPAGRCWLYEKSTEFSEYTKDNRGRTDTYRKYTCYEKVESDCCVGKISDLDAKCGGFDEKDDCADHKGMFGKTLCKWTCAARSVHDEESSIESRLDGLLDKLERSIPIPLP